MTTNHEAEKAAPLKWDDTARFKMINKHSFYPRREDIYDFGFYDGFTHAAERAGMAYAKESAWVDVKTECPADGRDVLICDAESGLVFIGHYTKSRKWFVNNMPMIVTHWNELPSPPENKVKEQ